MKTFTLWLMWLALAWPVVAAAEQMDVYSDALLCNGYTPNVLYTVPTGETRYAYIHTMRVTKKGTRPLTIIPMVQSDRRRLEQDTGTTLGIHPFWYFKRGTHREHFVPPLTIAPGDALEVICDGSNPSADQHTRISLRGCLSRRSDCLTQP